MPTVSILGASGYSGIELVRILSRHPKVKIENYFANSWAGRKVRAAIPSFRNPDLAFAKFDLELLKDSEFLFVALPTGEAVDVVQDVTRSSRVRIIDLGGDFRINDPAIYEQNHGRRHTAPELLSTAVYGLADWKGNAVKSARLVANPGCYATSILLPVLPLLIHGLVEANEITVSSISGVSGAGRNLRPEYSFCEIDENVRAYKVGDHSHIPEIERYFLEFGRKSAQITFVPHVGPWKRGIHSTIFLTPTVSATVETLFRCLRDSYSHTPFVRVLPESLPELKDVVGTNDCHIGIRMLESTRRLVLLSVLDNLLKGAAGQAVQNFNVMAGMDPTEGVT